MMPDPVMTEVICDGNPRAERLRAGRLEAWLIRNSTWVALAIIVVAFAIRVAYARACYLNPDEAIHFNAARPHSWLQAYRASLALSHPPLFILVLHAFLFFGRTELILRLPSILGGTTALWITFAWVRRMLGEIPALAGLLFVAFSPAAVSASTEVRQYGLLLFFLCGALYATERALNERSFRWVAAQSLFLLGAVLTHYITPVVILSIDLYLILRWLLDRSLFRTLCTFAAAQTVPAAALCLLYFRQIRRSQSLSASGLAYFSRDYYLPARESLVGFTSRATFHTVSYLSGAASQRMDCLVLLLFLAGLMALLAGRTKASCSIAFLVLCPFVVGFASAVARIYPFAGSRHQAFLLPFLAAIFAAAFTWIPRKLTASALLLAAPASLFWAAHAAPDNDPKVLPIGDIALMIEYIHQNIPQGVPIFVDDETRGMLEYYLGRDDASLDQTHYHLLNNETLDGHPIIQPQSAGWMFDPTDVFPQVRQAAKEVGIPANQSLWIVSDSWWWTVPLASRIAAERMQRSKTFGLISVVETVQD